MKRTVAILECDACHRKLQDATLPLLREQAMAAGWVLGLSWTEDGPKGWTPAQDLCPACAPRCPSCSLPAGHYWPGKTAGAPHP